MSDRRALLHIGLTTLVTFAFLPIDAVAQRGGGRGDAGPQATRPVGPPHFEFEDVRLQLDFPGAGDDGVGILLRHLQPRAAGVLVDEQRVLPGPAAVFDAALTAITARAPRLGGNSPKPVAIGSFSVGLHRPSMI